VRGTRAVRSVARKRAWVLNAHHRCSPDERYSAEYWFYHVNVQNTNDTRTSSNRGAIIRPDMSAGAAAVVHAAGNPAVRAAGACRAGRYAADNHPVENANAANAKRNNGRTQARFKYQ